MEFYSFHVFAGVGGRAEWGPETLPGTPGSYFYAEPGMVGRYLPIPSK